jgi:hypothetical protein
LGSSILYAWEEIAFVTLKGPNFLSSSFFIGYFVLKFVLSTQTRLPGSYFSLGSFA